MLPCKITNGKVKWNPQFRFITSRRLPILLLATGSVLLFLTIGVFHGNVDKILEKNLPWYLSIGKKRPTSSEANNLLKVWPEEKSGDRIDNQLMFIPNKKTVKNKNILLYNGLLYDDSRIGSEAFSECPMKSCYVSTNQEDAQDADAILFKNHMEFPEIQRSYAQVWILYNLESPFHTQKQSYPNLINWTATYRSDSDLVIPYGKWVYYDDKIMELPNPLKNFAANKTKKVAWFVSNCRAANNRLEYALELQKYIQVDIYGSCGNLSCPRETERSCLKLLSEHYKFYLAFENSNCQDYITEKLFVNSLQHDVLPIVMGARPEEYRRWTPKNSHIHVEEFESPRKLAEYLHKLDQNDDLYNSYFKWRGTGEVLTNTHLYCRLCALLHSDPPHKWYHDFIHWWYKPDTCTAGYWRDNLRTRHV